MIMSLVKNLSPQWRETKEENQLDQLMKKLLKQMTINEGKNWQIEIDEKPSNPMGTEEENRS